MNQCYHNTNLLILKPWKWLRQTNKSPVLMRIIHCIRLVHHAICHWHARKKTTTYDFCYFKHLTAISDEKVKLTEHYISIIIKHTEFVLLS